MIEKDGWDRIGGKIKKKGNTIKLMRENNNNLILIFQFMVLVVVGGCVSGVRVQFAGALTYNNKPDYLFFLVTWSNVELRHMTYDEPLPLLVMVIDIKLKGINTTY